jgi:hypothetical protein
MAVKKYVDLSGLSAFYDHLKTTYQPQLTAAGSGAVLPPQTSAVLNAVAPGVEAYENLTANSAAYSSGFAYISAMLDKSTYFNGTSAKYAEKATSATKAYQLTTSQNIAASGDATLSDISFNGTAGVTGKITIKSVPGSAISSVPWSAIDDYAAAVDTSTTNKFTTPKAVNDAITAAMTTKAAFKGPYATRGDIPAAALDKLSIYLIGPSGSGSDKYEEWVLTGTTTAQMLQIGDTSTDLSDYMKTSAFTAWSAGSNSTFNGSASKAGTATSANNASRLGGVTATTVTGNAASGAAASAWVTAHSGDYASASHDHAYTLSGNGTAVNVSAGVNFKPSGSNIKYYVSGNDIYISAKDTTYTSLNNINSNQYNALTAVSGLTGVKNYGTIDAKSGTTTKGTFTPSDSASTFTFIAGDNIDFVSGANSLTISAAQASTPGNGTISITTGASAATGKFTVNQSSATTITLGSMALAATSNYIATGDMIPYTSTEIIEGIDW